MKQNYVNRLEPRPFGNKQKAIENGFDWFREVVEGYVKSGKMRKPSEKELAKMWKDTTGLDVPDKPLKKVTND